MRASNANGNMLNRANSAMKRQRYLIMGHQRSGTTLIHSILKGHPRVAALNDELRIAPLFTRGVSTFTFGNDVPEEIEAGYLALFDAITAIRAAHKNALAHGAKVTCGSPDVARQLVESLQRYFRDLKIIHVVRRDLVAQFGSEDSMRRTGVAHSWSRGYAQRRIHNVRFNPWVFEGYASRCLRTQGEVDTLRGTHAVLDVVYEDYLANPESVHAQLFEFVGVPHSEVTWLEARKLMPPPDRYIDNYAALTNVLQQMRGDPPQLGGARLRAQVAFFLYRLRWVLASPRRMRESLLRLARRQRHSSSVA
ncbi:MAG: sulfotransferase [Candidatus Latescibacterota bacterium]|nr:MAG: sulfotransferase [Candidatus Latescibacterota bacterium]